MLVTLAVSSMRANSKEWRDFGSRRLLGTACRPRPPVADELIVRSIAKYAAANSGANVRFCESGS